MASAIFEGGGWEGQKYVLLPEAFGSLERIGDKGASQKIMATKIYDHVGTEEIINDEW